VEGNYAHLYNLMDLDVPDAAGIKELKRLLNGMHCSMIPS